MASNTHSLDWDQNIQWPWIKPVWTREDRSGFQLWKSIFSNSFVLLNLALCHACMDDCMNEWMHECTNARMHEFTNAWMNELMSAVILAEKAVTPVMYGLWCWKPSFEAPMNPAFSLISEITTWTRHSHIYSQSQDNTECEVCVTEIIAKHAVTPSRSAQPIRWVWGQC